MWVIISFFFNIYHKKCRWAQCLLSMYVWVLDVIFVSVPSQRHLLSNPSVAVFAMDCFAAQEFIEIRRRFWKLCPAVHDSSEKSPGHSEVVIIQGMQTVWMRGTRARLICCAYYFRNLCLVTFGLDIAQVNGPASCSGGFPAVARERLALIQLVGYRPGGFGFQAAASLSLLWQQLPGAEILIVLPLVWHW